MRYHSPRPVRSCRKTRDEAVRADTKTGLLPKEAYIILRAYSMQKTSYPTRPQLSELVEKVREIPGCEDCQIPKLQAYFKERRKTQKRALMAAKFKAGGCPKPEAEPDNVGLENAEADVEASPPTSPASELDSASSPSLSPVSAEPDPPSPSPPSESMPKSHLCPPTPSFTAVPTTFVDLGRWLQEQNRRFRSLKLVPL